MDNKNKKTNEKSKETVELIANFLFSFSLTIFIIISVCMIALKIFGFTLLNVETGSMQPELSVNSLIFVQRIDPAEISQGDIITFVMNEEGVLATHRVQNVDSGSRTFVTKGDANNTEDPPVMWDNVIGKVRFKIPGVGGCFQTLTSAENRPAVIIIIACFVIGMFVFEYAVKWIRKKKQAVYNDGQNVE